MEEVIKQLTELAELANDRGLVMFGGGAALRLSRGLGPHEWNVLWAVPVSLSRTACFNTFDQAKAEILAAENETALRAESHELRARADALEKRADELAKINKKHATP